MKMPSVWFKAMKWGLLGVVNGEESHNSKQRSCCSRDMESDLRLCGCHGNSQQAASTLGSDAQKLHKASDSPSRFFQGPFQVRPDSKASPVYPGDAQRVNASLSPPGGCRVFGAAAVPRARESTAGGDLRALSTGGAGPFSRRKLAGVRRAPPSEGSSGGA